MKLGLALRELHRSETELAQRLLHAGERHEADQDVYHLSRTLAAWSTEHVRAIAEQARRYDEDLDPEPRLETRLVERIRERAAEVLGREPEAGLLLLLDLREIYLAAAGVSVDWELIAQGAQGVQDLPLIELAQRCHAENLRQMRWANAKLKESATQVLLT
ncbi:hypothetical protein [Sporichthya polymorpha]|uniref:hypothetical protein n=1 Tax=Sporichthya polymorpha TaxID=35751 RepID=UPI000370FA5D|nr:hypothetical protein [Sporichthya polymorpha]